MVKVKKSPPFIESLTRALVNGLKGAGISAEVRAEPVPTTKLYRVMVQAPKFSRLKSYERQNLVWRIAEQTLPPDDQLKISMIITLTPAEAKGG